MSIENISEKANFLRNSLVNKYKAIAPDTAGLWGKMNPQQMMEHMSYSFRQANGKDICTCVTPEEHLPRMQAFLMSEKPFKENTPNQLLPDTPAPPVHATIDDSLAELQQEIEDFFTLFEKEPNKVLTNPFFGKLSYDMWVQLLHKHAWHHLRQFGVND
jgi:hypothetical protein